MRTVIVTGGRNYADAERIAAELTHLAPTKIIHGGAPGADTLAGLWAFKHCVPVTVYRADWKSNGLAAGPIRNELMCRDNQDATVLAFPGGRGTANCVMNARAFNMRVIEVK